MKAARLVVLSVAIAAGGIAALLGRRARKSRRRPRPRRSRPDRYRRRAGRRADIADRPDDLARRHAWQTWPAAAAGGNFIRKNEQPHAIERFSGAIVRAPFVAGEPIREAKLVKAKGSGFMAAILPSGMRAVSTRDLAGNRRRRLHPAERPRRRDPVAPRQEQASGNRASYVSETILTNVRVLAIDQTVEEKDGQNVVVGKTATLELTPGRPRLCARRARSARCR